MTTMRRALAALPRPVLLLSGSLGVVAGLLAVIAVAAPQWIESLVGLSPDGGSGEAEVGLVVVLASAAVLLIGLALAGAAASRAAARATSAGAAA